MYRPTVTGPASGAGASSASACSSDAGSPSAVASTSDSMSAAGGASDPSSGATSGSAEGAAPTSAAGVASTSAAGSAWDSTSATGAASLWASAATSSAGGSPGSATGSVSSTVTSVGQRRGQRPEHQAQDDDDHDRDHDHASESILRHRRLPVVLELERDRLVELTQSRDDLLQLVLALARDANGVALDLRLALGKLVADELGDALRDVLGQALAQPDDLADLVPTRRLHLAPVEDLQREVAPDGLALDEVLDRRGPVFVVGDQGEVGLALGQVHGHALEVVALLDLAPHLVQGIAQLLLVEVAYDVEGHVAGHRSSSYPACPEGAVRVHSRSLAMRPSAAMSQVMKPTSRTRAPS